MCMSMSMRFLVFLLKISKVGGGCMGFISLIYLFLCVFFALSHLLYAYLYPSSLLSLFFLDDLPFSTNGLPIPLTPYPLTTYHHTITLCEFVRCYLKGRRKKPLFLCFIQCPPLEFPPPLSIDRPNQLIQSHPPSCPLIEPIKRFYVVFLFL